MYSTSQSSFISHSESRKPIRLFSVLQLRDGWLKTAASEKTGTHVGPDEVVVSINQTEQNSRVEPLVTVVHAAILLQTLDGNMLPIKSTARMMEVPS